ncbi:chromosome 9 open reading frame 117 [Nesidiocoris tenuis]|uniref:Cilia- and flagella-associated protein 157 n=1 Tax=Nesidiocoris tenuis TaxID=355587 RepID=A0ABN7B089_9HEMI|nr:chromosome 9 open reading frame 117 [Nesidiocoris tenuis]
MGPKQQKKKTKELTEAETAILQAYREQQQVEQLQHLAKLSSAAERAADENKRLKNELRQEKRDGAHLVAFLRRKLGEVCEEVLGIREINEALESERAKAKQEFEAELAQKQNEYAEMCERLTNNIKTLQGKIDNLEEYQAQRDFLLDKNNQLDSYLKVMETQARAIEKEYEKGSLIDKNRMRREMEVKLERFKVEFQKATKKRIAIETRNIIDENVAVNNELGLIIASWQKLHEENEKLRGENRRTCNEIDAQRQIKAKLDSKNRIQSETIERLALEHEKLSDYHRQGEQFRQKARQLRTRIQELKKKLDSTLRDFGDVRQENGHLQEKLSYLECKSKEVRAFKTRNARLIETLRKELDASMSGDDNETRECRLARLGQKFNALFDLLEEDWILEGKPENANDASMDTVVGKMGGDFDRLGA